jgi:hypothetical protein
MHSNRMYPIRQKRLIGGFNGFEAADFPSHVLTPQERAREDRMRTELEKRASKK